MFLNVLIESPIRFSLGAPLESDFACVLCLQANPGHGCVFPRKNPPAVYSWLCLEPPRPQGSPRGGVRAEVSAPVQHMGLGRDPCPRSTIRGPEHSTSSWDCHKAGRQR